MTNSGQFKPGQSGNPAGPPKRGESLSAIMRRMLDKKDVQYGNTMISRREALAEKMWELAMQKKPDMKAMKLILEYTEGAPKQTIEHAAEINILPPPKMTVKKND